MHEVLGVVLSIGGLVLFVCGGVIADAGGRARHKKGAVIGVLMCLVGLGVIILGLMLLGIVTQ